MMKDDDMTKRIKVEYGPVTVAGVGHEIFNADKASVTDDRILHITKGEELVGRFSNWDA